MKNFSKCILLVLAASAPCLCIPLVSSANTGCEGGHPFDSGGDTGIPDCQDLSTCIPVGTCVPIGFTYQGVYDYVKNANLTQTGDCVEEPLIPTVCVKCESPSVGPVCATGTAFEHKSLGGACYGASTAFTFHDIGGCVVN